MIGNGRGTGINLGGDSGNGGGGGHGGGSERWLLTYADLITLLMVFFIVLYSMSELDKEKYARVANYLSMAFGQGSLVINSSGLGSGFAIMRSGDLRALAPETARLARPAPIQAAPDPLLSLGEELRHDFVHEGRFAIRVVERGLTISLVGSAAFDSGDAEIRPEFFPVLDAISRRLSAIPHDISIEGFTDDDPIRTAEYPSNWYLSTARANRVRDYLEQGGIEAYRMIVVGYGATRPAWSNATGEGKAKNRRVDIVILRERRMIDPGHELGQGDP